MATRTRNTRHALERIQRIRAVLQQFELLCSGTLSKRLMKCGKPNCRCATEPSARHGPYHEWSHMKAGKPTRRYVSEQQAQLLRQAIADYRTLQKLLREWEENSERIIDAVQPPQP